MKFNPYVVLFKYSLVDICMKERNLVWRGNM